MNVKWLLGLSIAVAASMGLTACQNSEVEVTTSPLSDTLPNSHAISVKEALATLDDFLKDGSARTRSASTRVANLIES